MRAYAAGLAPAAARGPGGCRSAAPRVLGVALLPAVGAATGDCHGPVGEAVELVGPVEAVGRLVGATRAVVGLGPPGDGAANRTREVAQGVGHPLAVLGGAALRRRARRGALTASGHADRQGRWRRLRVGGAGDSRRPGARPGVLGDGADPDGPRRRVAEVVERRLVRAGTDGLVAVAVDLVAGDRPAVARRGPPPEGDGVAVLAGDVEVRHALGRPVGVEADGVGPRRAVAGRVAGPHLHRLLARAEV